MARFLPPLVLTGHDVFYDVASRSASEVGITTSVETLVGILRSVRADGYSFVDLDTFLQNRRRGGVALLTFDDAFESIASVVAPLLAAEKIPALLFVIGDALEHGDGLQHAVMMMRDRALPPEGASTLAELAADPVISRLVAASGHGSLRDIFNLPLDAATDVFASGLTAPDLKHLAGAVAGHPGLGRLTLSRTQLQALVRSGLWELGAHSVTHSRFGRLGRDQIEVEVADSVAAVAKLTGKNAREIAFAYPYGSYTLHAARVVSRHGRAGFTGVARAVSRFDSKALLPRFNLDAGTIDRIARAGRQTHLGGLVREKALLHLRNVRETPVWNVLGPLRNALRSAR